MLTALLRFVAASAAKAELCALFVNMKHQKGKNHLYQTPQPPTPIYCDNSTDKVKQQCLRSMKCNIFDCISDRTKESTVPMQPGQENLLDSFT